MNDAGVAALHQDRQGAAGAFDQALGAFAVAGDRWVRCACALASFEALSRTSSPAKRSRRRRTSARDDKAEPLAADDQPLCGVG